MPTAEPMIRLDPGGQAPIISYNVPEPTSYSGQHLLELKFPADYFKPALQKAHAPARTSLASLETTAVRGAVVTAMKTGFSDSKLFPNVRVSGGALRFAEKSQAGLRAVSSQPLSQRLSQLDPDEVAAMLQAGKRLNVYRSMYGSLTYNYLPEPVTPRPRLLLVETYRLSSFLGSYGAGRVLKTFSLLPGERTRISVKSYTRRESDAKSASSILDSFTEESATDFESSLQSEQSDKQAYSESFEYHAEAEASASWGFGSAKVSGGVKGGTSSAREEFAKNVSSATQKQAAKASAKRDVQVNTSYEVKEESGEETCLEREIQNINLSRTLNFVFRQMNQEFISLLHLVDVRVAFFNGFAESKREVPLPELDSLLEEVLVDDEKKRREVREVIVAQLRSLTDYQDLPRDFVEERALGSQDKYLRVKRDLTSVYQDASTGTRIAVPGIIMAATRSVLRTEGVIVEALLGQGEALDSYATRLQDLEVSRRKAERDRAAAEAERLELGNQLARDNAQAQAALLVELTRAQTAEKAAVSVAMHSEPVKAP